MQNRLHLAPVRAALAVLALCGLNWNLLATESRFLWHIGAPDTNTAEFALAPGDFAKYKADGFYVVGESDAKRDWPYAHPGPSDAWAGSRQHTFTILFGLKTPPAAGECRLAVGLLDTHYAGPPQLRIRINGRDFEQNLPKGGADDSIRGQLTKGRPHQFRVAFPSDLLRAGDNDIQITTINGSWMLYDWLGLETPDGAELGTVASHTVVGEVEAIRALREQDGRMTQPVRVTLRHFGEPQDAILRAEGAATQTLKLQRGEQSAEVFVPAVDHEGSCKINLEANGKTLLSRDVPLKPVRKLTVYILPHSHTDIGYTEIQTAIEKKQVNNLLEGMAAAKRTADYPPGARFVWNVEVLWAADLYLHRLNDQQRAAFFAAVKSGQVVLNGMYLNELTGLCRPEELVELFRYATTLAEKTGVPIDSAMISDVPGYTWGTVTAMAQAGIKYFSTAPNYFDRIGTILREWENRPFYWVGPDGQSKVLVWIPFWGYAMSHIYHQMSPKLVDDFFNGLEKRGYSFDIAYVRWSGHGDNAVPDPAICEFVKDWNSRYSWPKFIISGTGEAFRAFEKRYGKDLPLVRGDWTPYWEDGAGSSALETAMNRQSSDRLVQAETVFAMLKSLACPTADFQQAWNNVLLYSEHTWGAWCSISEPERKETREQWEIKKSYADQADRQSRQLLEKALATLPTDIEFKRELAITNRDTRQAPPGSLDVLNTLSWARTALVTFPPAMASGTNDLVLDDRGQPVPSQRLSSGELAFLAEDVPPFAARRYRVTAGPPCVKARATAHGATLDSGAVRVRVDEQTGGIVELTSTGIEGNFADTSGGGALNDYRYLIGNDLKELKRNGPVRISVGEKGPLVASLIIESDAPGCTKLRRELRVVAGLDYVAVINLVEKARLPAKSYQDKAGKESLNFAFPFHVPDGELLLDVPLGLMRPEADQMPSACKNWFTVGRWADVSNPRSGVTWVTLDAPLVEVGGITATLLNSQTNPDIWRKTVGRTQTVYSWAMNNHWGTNYRAYQDGPTAFRFILRPHRQPDPAEATRFATGFSQPLLPWPARDPSPIPSKPLLRVAPADVLVTALKPSQDGKALIVRLFGASGKATSATLDWGGKAVFLSDTSEQPKTKVSGPISVPGCGLVTLRLEFDFFP